MMMSIFTSIKGLFVTTEQDVVKFVEDVWNEVPVAASRIAAISKWLANVGLPAFQKDLDFALPVMTAVSAATSHPELGASLVALDAATHAVTAAIGSAQSGSLSADQVVTAIGALSSAEATFNSAKATTAKIVATTPATK
jgi:hypothetical protein